MEKKWFRGRAQWEPAPDAQWQARSVAPHRSSGFRMTHLEEVPERRILVF